MKTREQIIDEARRQREEIAQYFRDIQQWNETRKIFERYIAPDPDGTLQKLADALDKMLATESHRCLTIQRGESIEGKKIIDRKNF